MYIFEENKTHRACYFCLMLAKQKIDLSWPAVKVFIVHIIYN